MWSSLHPAAAVLCTRQQRAVHWQVEVSGGCRSPHPPKEEGFKRVVMCSGKVYYELAKKRAELKKEKEVAIIRLEQVLLSSSSLYSDHRQLFRLFCRLVSCLWSRRRRGLQVCISCDRSWLCSSVCLPSLVWDLQTPCDCNSSPSSSHATRLLTCVFSIDASKPVLLSRI